MVTPSIAVASIFRLMVLTIHLEYQLQCHTTKVGCVWREGILATKLLGSAPSMANDLPHALCKLIGSDTLVSHKRYCIGVVRMSSCSARTPLFMLPLAFHLLTIPLTDAELRHAYGNLEGSGEVQRARHGGLLHDSGRDDSQHRPARPVDTGEVGAVERGVVTPDLDLVSQPCCSVFREYDHIVSI